MASRRFPVSFFITGESGCSQAKPENGCPVPCSCWQPAVPWRRQRQALPACSRSLPVLYRLSKPSIPLGRVSPKRSPRLRVVRRPPPVAPPPTAGPPSPWLWSCRAKATSSMATMVAASTMSASPSPCGCPASARVRAPWPKPRPNPPPVAPRLRSCVLLLKFARRTGSGNAAGSKRAWPASARAMPGSSLPMSPSGSSRASWPWPISTRPRVLRPRPRSRRREPGVR